MATEYNATTGSVKTSSTTDSDSAESLVNKKKTEAEAVGKTSAEDIQKQFDTRAKNSASSISGVYDANLSSQKQALLNAYNENTAAQEQQGQNIRENTAAAAYDVGVQNARNAAGLNRFADVRGVNTQGGSQQALSLGNAAARADAAINFQLQQALQENERQQQMTATAYHNQVAAALADNDYKKAAALLDDYNNQKKWQENQASILASYGNFSGYKGLYGDNAAITMQNVWNAQNPDVAYRTGQIDAETYKNITGNYPAGYESETSYVGYDYIPGGSGDGGLGGPGGGKGGQTASLFGLNNASVSVPVLTPTAINAAERYK